jgi:hypothetical protein
VVKTPKVRPNVLGAARLSRAKTDATFRREMIARKLDR